ncbi:nicotinamide-nucleotide adenylyltransferase [Candidatus Methanoliparum sp. LAM-1]|uniref:nicotinamide-nucleotide adenylyltransferase n=1 Tax=Candidatus Methanoliparum sp. LAM-1 TaxID=2874846 RepID=UPI001E3895EA|nr:nicotinamide-nucleotide adenylyltransferase [Candidatus Methanoliparum sp. LAM-1]BDC35469.1 nicotinamide-nucleotide adenylyltransferase [Candidatus Methanoliparum sp. LAM-1]
MKRAFYIGRFQPYHKGHHAIIDMISKEVDEIIIGIGSAQLSHTLNDPFTAGERVMMITRSLCNLNIMYYVIPIEDINRHALWVSHIKSMVPPFNTVYSNNPLVIRLFEEEGIEVKTFPLLNREEYMGKKIRERILNDEKWDDLVPKAVFEVIEEIKGKDRLKRIKMSDRHMSF